MEKTVLILVELIDWMGTTLYLLWAQPSSKHPVG